MKKLFLAFLLLCSSVASADTSVRTLYTNTPVDTVTWVKIVSSIARPVNSMSIYDSSTQTMQLGLSPYTGSSPTQVIIIPPGGGGFPQGVSTGQAVWLRALSSSATTGENDINFFY